MRTNFVLGLEDEKNPVAVSIYNQFFNGDYQVWIKIGRGVLEIQDEKMLQSVIDILNQTKEEIHNLKQRN